MQEKTVKSAETKAAELLDLVRGMLMPSQQDPSDGCPQTTNFRRIRDEAAKPDRRDRGNAPRGTGRSKKVQ